MNKSLLFHSLFYIIYAILLALCISIHKGVLNSALLRCRAKGSYSVGRFEATQWFTHIPAASYWNKWEEDKPSIFQLPALFTRADFLCWIIVLHAGFVGAFPRVSSGNGLRSVSPRDLRLCVQARFPLPCKNRLSWPYWSATSGTFDSDTLEIPQRQF